MCPSFKKLTRMKLLYSYVSVLSILLTIITYGQCDENPGLETAPNTPPESEDWSTPESPGSSALPESDSTSMLSETASSSSLPSVSLTSAPGWWVGISQPENTSEAETESENEIFKEENGTSNGEWFPVMPPLIIFRYPLEMIVGSFIPENGTFKFESENGNNSSENEFDFSEFNMTEFPSSSLEGRVEGEMTFDSPNDTEIWFEDYFIIPDENVTEGAEKNTDEMGTVLPNENEDEETTVLPSDNENEETTDQPSDNENEETTVLPKDNENEETTVLPSENEDEQTTFEPYENILEATEPDESSSP